MVRPFNTDILIARLTSAERTIGKLEENAQNARQDLARLQDTVENLPNQPPSGSHNMIRNGNGNWTRNRYLYSTDQAADVDEEAAFIYTHPPDTAVESRTGSIGAGSHTLSIGENSFIVGDATLEIVVEGAGTAGADLVTTIQTYNAANSVDLTAAAVTAVNPARVRWRLQQIKEDTTDSDADSNAATNSALKTSAHSLYATTINDPAFDKNAGVFLLGSGKTIDFPLPFNLIENGNQPICSFIAKLASSITLPADLKLFAGIWDDSPGRRLFLEGTPFNLTVTPIGTPGSTVSREYLIVAFIDDNTMVFSKKVAVTAPANGFFVTDQKYVALSWDKLVGILTYRVYRKTGATYELIAVNDSGFPAWYDQGAIVSTESGYPAGTDREPNAIAQAINFTPTTDWQEIAFKIPVPQTYKQGGTTGKQWLRLFLNQSLGVGNDRKLIIDKVCLSLQDGKFSYNPLDYLAKRQGAGAPDALGQGTTGTGGGGIIITPDPGGGGPRCVVEDMLVVAQDARGREEWRAAGQIRRGDYCLTAGMNWGRVRAVEVTEPVTVYRLRTRNGCVIKGSPGHRILQGFSDGRGLAIQSLQPGAPVLTYVDGQKVVSAAREVAPMKRARRVVKISIAGPDPTYIAGARPGLAVAQHNVKPEQGNF